MAMREALTLARQAALAGDVPVGALVLDPDGRIIGRGFNTRETGGDPLAHAEIIAMREAADARRRGLLADGLHRVGSGVCAAQSALDESAPDDSVLDWRAMGGTLPSDAGGIAAEAIGPSASASKSDSVPVSPARAWNLADCTLVVTLEPCPMCAGACIQTHVGRIVFGAWDAKLGACGSVWDIPRDPHVGHAPEVYGGVLESACRSILTDFFATRR